MEGERQAIPVNVAQPEKDREQEIVFPILWYEGFQECQNEKRKPAHLNGREKSKFVNELFRQILGDLISQNLLAVTHHKDAGYDGQYSGGFAFTL